MRLTHLLLAVALTIGSGLAGPAVSAETQTPFRPVAMVNGAVITGFDVMQRATILDALGYKAPNADARRSQALQHLIDDRLKLQEARRSGIAVTPDMIEAGIEAFARQRDMKPDAFRALLSKKDVSADALEAMVRAEIGWIQVVRARFQDDQTAGTAPGTADGAESTEYLVREIGLSLHGNDRSEAETRELAQKLSRTLGRGGDFGAAVARYSAAPSAERGGRVGWVSTDRLPSNLRVALQGLDVGEVSAPLEVSGGISVIKVIDKRTVQVDPQASVAAEDRQIGAQTRREAEALLQELRNDALIDLR